LPELRGASAHYRTPEDTSEPEELVISWHSRIRYLGDTLRLFVGLAVLGALCLAWTALALPLLLLLPGRRGELLGRLGIVAGFRLFIGSLRLLGLYRLDLSALRALRNAPPMVLAPNHPSVIDALLIIAREPRVSCVMKTSLRNNLFLGAGARLAGYIRHEPPRQMIHDAIAELARGGIVLLFPEGTRTRRAPINVLQAGVGIIAKNAAVPVQTLIIETDSPYASKGWSLFRPPRFPITCRMQLGRRFEPPSDVRDFTLELEAYFRDTLDGALQNQWLEERSPSRAPATIGGRVTRAVGR
jgi:1-acyl-sn-glycerol-3-phosphate acyltransferase